MSGANFLLLVRLGFSLSLVFGLMWLAGRVLKGRAPMTARRNQDHVEVIERKALSRTSSIAVVRVGEQVLALGVSDANVTVLSEVDLAAIDSGAVNSVAVDSTAAPLPLGPNAELPASSTSTTGPVVVSSPSAPRPAQPSRQGWLDTLRDKTVRHIPS